MPNRKISCHPIAILPYRSYHNLIAEVIAVTRIRYHKKLSEGVGTVHNYQYKNYEELESAIINYVDYYNQRRIKTKLVGMSPVKYREYTSQLAA
ncbi:IS3 family transposase [Lactiplantibacillus plantarum]|uniref:IS3 family transposase n=1 Tax=Lactiplantibacillus plantarum TaxID=1590 RepID=UPI004045DC40